MRGEPREVRGELLHKIGAVREGIGSDVRTIVMANFVSVLTAVGIVVATLHFLG
jgi:hypothetical protein